MEEVKQNLETQLQEIEMLQSMFSNPGEIRIDELELTTVSNFVGGTFPELPPYLDFAIKLKIDSEKFELCVTLPHDYPNVEPEIFVRNEKQSRAQHAKLNRELMDFISNQDRGVPCIYDAVTWLQENAQNYIESEPEVVVVNTKTFNDTFVRYWIYSHHIYSTIKRREIVNLAENLNLKGFSLPGKPGIVCIEGYEDDCEEWWQTIKAMNWKRILLKVKEECTEDRDSFLKFDKFQEVAFKNGNVRSTHMDMSELCKYMEAHGCGYVFKELFGVDQKGGSADKV